MKKDTERFVVPGFSAAAAAAGLKKDGKEDMALIVSDVPAAAAAVFTTNRVKAAPVLLSQDRIGRGVARAIVANAGNANACTGETGLADARRTADLAARHLGIEAEDVLVASTGVIGQPLDMPRVEAAIPRLVGGLTPHGLPEAARAIMTTDSFEKLSAYAGTAKGVPYRVVGMAKGAGMIMPDMATMLCFVATDIGMDSATLNRVLRQAVGRTFNRVSVDGDTSTNDTVFLLANGMAGNPVSGPADVGDFSRGLTTVLEDLARMLVRDGEGATKEIEILVRGAASPEDALRAARTVANSSLVKTAFYGRDANWGRIMAALGRAGIAMDPGRVDVALGGVQVVSRGLGLGPAAEKAAEESMSQDAFTLAIDLHQGVHEERFFTCDLTHDYVSINAHYRT